MSLEPHYPTSYHARIDAAGRVTIPAEVRHLHNLHKGDDVLLVASPSGLEIRTRSQALLDAQALFSRAVPASRSLSQELIDERAAEAAADD